MMTWSEFVKMQPTSSRAVLAFAAKLGNQGTALDLGKAVVGHMRQHGWSYVGGVQPLGDAISRKTINCQNLADLLVGLYVYYSSPNGVNAAIKWVCAANAAVFLPQTAVVRAGLVIHPNVQGVVPGFFFSSGHQVASLAGVCFDLISGNKGPEARMNAAYLQCTQTLPAPNNQYTFMHAGQLRHLDIQPGFTAEGLRNYACT